MALKRCQLGLDARMSSIPYRGQGIKLILVGFIQLKEIAMKKWALVLVAVALGSSLPAVQAATIDFANSTTTTTPITEFSNSEINIALDWGVANSSITTDPYPFTGVRLEENVNLDIDPAQNFYTWTLGVAPLMSFDNLVRIVDEPNVYIMAYPANNSFGFEGGTDQIVMAPELWTITYPTGIKELSFQFQTGIGEFDEGGVLVQRSIGMGITSIGYTPLIPEPQTYALMIAGLGIIGTIARRRAKKKDLQVL